VADAELASANRITIMAARAGWSLMARKGEMELWVERAPYPATCATYHVVQDGETVESGAESEMLRRLESNEPVGGKAVVAGEWTAMSYAKAAGISYTAARLRLERMVVSNKAAKRCGSEKVLHKRGGGAVPRTQMVVLYTIDQ
jgi:hypothetical protein